MTHAKVQREGYITALDIGIERIAVGFAVCGMHVLAPRQFIPFERARIEPEHRLDRRRHIKLVVCDIPIPYAHASARQGEGMALFAAQRADIRAAAATLCVIGGRKCE